MNWLVRVVTIALICVFSLTACITATEMTQNISEVTPLVSFETQSSILIITSTQAPSPSPTYTSEPTMTGTPVPTLTPTPVPPTPTVEAPFFDQFVMSVVNNNPAQLVGVYVDGVMAYPVIQQPSGNAAFVSALDNVVTRFALVTQMFSSNIGLLGHNYLAGRNFIYLTPGQIITLVYGDGSTRDYDVQYDEKFQALNPLSPTTNFVDLVSGDTLTSTELFYRVYGGNTTTTLQTCIDRNGNSSWGRLFVIAPIQ